MLYTEAREAVQETTGFYALFRGLSELALAFQVRSAHQMSAGG